MGNKRYDYNEYLKDIMETTLNLNNKLKYFASYAIDKPILSHVNGGMVMFNDLVNLRMIFQDQDPMFSFANFILILKSIDDLSYLDAKELLAIKSTTVDGSGEEVLTLGRLMAEKSGEDFAVSEFLKLKGYAIPFFTYSVEQLIEANWLRFKEPKFPIHKV